MSSFRQAWPERSFEPQLKCYGKLKCDNYYIQPNASTSSLQAIVFDWLLYYYDYIKVSYIHIIMYTALLELAAQHKSKIQNMEQLLHQKLKETQEIGIQNEPTTQTIGIQYNAPTIGKYNQSLEHSM